MYLSSSFLRTFRPRTDIIFISLIVSIMMALVTNRAGLASTTAGELDPTFGDGGIANTDFTVPVDSRGYAVAIQADGKRVVSGWVYHEWSQGDFALSRYNIDGTLDTGFGNAGWVSTDFYRWDDNAYAVAIQPDGKIVAGGMASYSPSSSSFALARYLPDGSLDSSFGAGGIVTTNAGTDTLNALVVQPDGKILAAGTGHSSTGTAYDFTLARYLADGTLDSTFGTGGIVINDLGGPGSYDFIDAIVLQVDGKIIAAGASSGDFALVRYLADGTQDSTFGTNGKVITDFGTESDWVNDVALTFDGLIIAGGQTGNSTNRRFALAAYLSTGALDESFGTEGKVVTDFAGTTSSHARSLSLGSDGKILLAGDANICPAYCHVQLALARYLPNGTPDTSFGSGGQVLTSFGSGIDATTGDMVVETSGKALVVGTAVGQHPMSTALARYLPNGALDTSFGNGGTVLSSFSASNAYATSVALQTDGKIVAVGMSTSYCSYSSCSPNNFALARYLVDGSLDTSFGAGGQVTTSFSEGEAQAYGVRIQPDGKIVVVGYAGGGTNGAFALARYLPGGNLDPSFGNGGKVVTNVDSVWRDAAFTLALQADGKIVAAGYTPYGGLAVVRYLPNGSLDTTFNYDGIVTTTINRETAYAFSVAVQPDGKILAGGSTSRSCSTTCTHIDFALVRYLSNGQLDLGFGTDGIAVTSLGTNNDSRVYGLALQSDGKIVAGGYTGIDCPSGCASDFALARYTTAGALDTTFGTNGTGIITTDFAGSSDVVFGIVTDWQDRILTVGRASTSQAAAFGLARYLPNGSLDSSFGSGGKVITQVGVSNSEANAVVVDVEGRIIVAGQSRTADGSSLFSLARYQGSGGAPQPTPTSTTTSTPATTTTPVPPSPVVSPSPIACGSNQFSDVHTNDYFYSAVQYMSCHSIISGYADGAFRPYNNTTRGQLTKIVSLAQGWQLITPLTPQTPTFIDVPAADVFYPYIETAYRHNIISGYKGYSCGTGCLEFRPGDNVTRAQLSKIIVLAESWSLITPQSATFRDVPPTNNFYGYVETAYRHNIISGYSCVTGCLEFRPADNATRGQISKIVYQAGSQP